MGWFAIVKVCIEGLHTVPLDTAWRVGDQVRRLSNSARLRDATQRPYETTTHMNANTASIGMKRRKQKQTPRGSSRRKGRPPHPRAMPVPQLCSKMRSRPAEIFGPGGMDVVSNLIVITV